MSFRPILQSISFGISLRRLKLPLNLNEKKVLEAISTEYSKIPLTKSQRK